tara:strand:- start:534 stop:689 length:156 start_codon:yes stop_codon:yes gene_type:complete
MINIYFVEDIYWIEFGRVLDYSPCGLVTTLVAQGYKTPYYKGFATDGESIA